MEAKARKKRRVMKRMEKAKKKAEVLMENEDVTDREKARQIKKYADSFVQFIFDTFRDIKYQFYF